MTKLNELSLENNPITEDRVSYYQLIFELCDSLSTLDSVPVAKIQDELAAMTQEFDRNEENNDPRNKTADEKGFSNSQSNFRRKGNEDPAAANKAKPNPKNPAKFKSLSPTKKNEDPKNKNSSKDPKSASLAPSDKKSDDDDNNLEPEKVITIIKDQFYKEIQRVEVILKLNFPLTLLL